MKKVFVLLLLLIAIAVPSYAIDKSGLFGIGVKGGFNVPLSGDITTDSSLSDFFDLGPKFGIFVNYTFSKELTLESGFNYGFMKLKDDANDILPEEPHLVMPELYLSAKYNLGSFITKQTNPFNPFLSAGVSMIPWKITDDGAGGDAQMVGLEEFKKTSFGLNFGGGLETFISKNMTLLLESRYVMVFSEDEEKFGTVFGNMSTLDINTGLTYYLPLSSM